MNDTLPAFDIGDHFNVLTRSFSQNITLFAVIAAIAAVATVASNMVFGVESFLSGIIGLLIYVIAGPVAMMVAFDANAGREIRTQDYFNRAISMFFPILLLSIVQGLLVGLGFMLLIFPGLYIAAMLYVIVPAIVIEKAGFSGFNRSLKLTEGYRMSILLVVLAVFLICLVMSLLGLAIQTALSVIPFVGEGLNAFINTFVYLIPAVSSALVYWRIVERKEGTSLTDIADVFA